MAALRTTLFKPVWWLLATLMLLMALAGGLWLWSDSNTSLATVIGQLSRVLPAGQTLESRDINGSVRAGGQIGWLRWSEGNLSIEARDVRVGWSLAALLHRELRLSELSVGHLRIEDKRAPTPDAASAPPTAVSLPLRVDAAVSVATVEWIGSSSQTITELSGHYIFDSYLHKLDKGQVHISSGNYQLSGTLQAQAPMALALQLSGMVQTIVPSSARSLNVSAQASLSGTLAGADARLALQATLNPELVTTGKASTGKQPVRQATQASLSAELAPWQAQKVISAQGTWQALDLAALWPQAPQTQLAGSASVTPAGPGWLAHITLGNTLSGPWNQQRLPLQTLNAALEFANGQWLVQSLQASGADGSVLGSGQLSDGLWRMNAKVQGINPGAIDSRLARASLSGALHAQQSANGIGFEADLQAAPGKASRADAPKSSASASSALQALQLQSLSTKGLWAAPLLTLEALHIDAKEAQLQGQLSYQTVTQATRGKLLLSLPGLQSSVDGQLASTNGQGKLALHVTDAALATAWLARWPSVANALKGTQWQGSAELSAQWQGGWQREAQDLHINASLLAPRLDRRSTTQGVAEWHLRDLQADLKGTPSAMALSTRGLAESGTQTLSWQAQANAGRINAGAWQASVPALQLSLQNSTLQRPWSLRWGHAAGESGKPVTLNWRQTDAHNTLDISGGSAQLQGPAPGVANVVWQPARWSQTTASIGAQPQWQSQGRVTGLPLAWIDAVSTKPLAELGLSSDLLLSGAWSVSQADSLRAQVTLERSAGDLRLHTADSRQPVLLAGMREAWLQVNLEGGQVAASLRWDSARAGRALLAFSTQLQARDSGWAWPGDAPLGGSLQLQLPPVDAWSALAPPGWRLRGTMDADIALAGTLDTPKWSGTLKARDLALRSVVDGLDFSQGTLDAHLHDQQLDIDNFTLQGAGGSLNKSATTGGQVSLSGSVFWLPASTGAGPAARLRMALVAQANALRLSSRPDRRVVLSGKLTADLLDARLKLRGALNVDQALITLPDDAAPQLGDDVLVRAPITPAQTAKAAAKTGTTAKPRVIPDVLVDLDLGPDFQVRGRGLQARLAGKLTLRAQGTELPSLNGTVRTVGGSYRAYGQQLAIERGVLRFSGPMDNPALNILAIRPKLTQRVGVQITGTALSPIIRLYAEPDLPEAEKLAWLVLGRSASGGGAEAALMQQAALALLGGNGQSLSGSLAQALGLDELSFSGNNTSETGASAASITLGKRLSSDFYVAYESSLVGTMGVFSIFYDLSKSLTLRARTGEQTAIDLIYTLRYD